MRYPLPPSSRPHQRSSPAAPRAPDDGPGAPRGRSGAPSAPITALATTLALAAALALAPADADAQAGSASTGADSSARSPDGAAWSFPVGERAVYDVSVTLGSVVTSRPLGQARLTVEGREQVDGHDAYRVALEVEGRVPFVYEMNNRQVSWVGPDPVRSLRFEEHLREGDYRRDRRYRLDQEAQAFTRYDLRDGSWARVEEEADVPMPPNALDEVSFLYFIRTLPLEPGATYRYERFFEEDGNPVELEVLDRETIRVPAGRFEAVVVRPVIQTDGLFSEGGKARVWISDDDRRLILKIESSMKVGRVDMHLRSFRPASGEPTIGDGP